MDELVDLWETPLEHENYMIAGWEQWADAGEVSSGLPQYLIERTGAHKIGEIHPDRFYLFQTPGTHHLMRPQVRLVDGYREEMTVHRNDLYYAQVGDKGLLIFVGEEPHQNEDRYADALFDLAELLQVRRIVAVGGVYGAMPYDRDREISCVYSLPRMRAEMAKYAVRFSNYEGGTTIGIYMAHWAEYREMELAVLNAFVPAYEFSQGGLAAQGLRVEQDWKAWYDVMRRVDYMFGAGIDLSELRTRSQELVTALDAKVAELAEKHPEMNVKEYLAEVAQEFEERPFIPLDDVWDELRDVLGNMDE